jgi:prepilin peptidase CpaA
MTAATSTAWIAILLFAGTMAYAGLKDIDTMTITNRLVLWLAAAFLLLAPIAGLGIDEISAGVFAALAVLACTFALFARGWIGGGDAKLAAVAVLWLGSGVALEFVLYASVFGTMLTLALLQFRRMPLPDFLQETGWPCRLHSTETGVPYGAALAASALFLLPKSQWAAVIL